MHHFFHRVICIDPLLRLSHEFIHIETVVQLLTEHKMTDIIQYHNTDQNTIGLYDRNRFRVDLEITFTISAKSISDVPQKIGFHYAFNVHHCQNGLVLVMGNQFSLLGQTHGVNAVRLEHNDCQVCTDGNNHQRQEQSITARKFGNQKDTGQGACMTPDISPAIPISAKFFSGMKTSPILNSLQTYENTKPQYTPRTDSVQRYHHIRLRHWLHSKRTP